MAVFKKAFVSFVDVCREFAMNSTMHGFKFIADGEKHWTERLFWMCCLMLSYYGTYLLIGAQWDSYQNNAISFVVETTYKDWDTYFPTVALCETDTSERIEDSADRLWTSNHDFNLEEVLKEIAYFRGVTYYTIQYCTRIDADPNCPKTNLSYYSTAVRAPCKEILEDCSWNGVPFPCCQYFNPIETEMGICYAINSIQGIKPNPEVLHMVSNRTTGPGKLTMNVLTPGNLYIMGHEEVPALTTLVSEILTLIEQVHYSRFISIRTIENDATARFVDIDKRKCRYIDENNLNVYRYYSYSACTVQCRKDAQLRKCNCTNFLMPNTPEKYKCDLHGIMCLNEFYNELSVLKAKWSTRSGLYCNCLPSCTEYEITAVKDFQRGITENFAAVDIQLAYLPSERFRRNVVRGKLDLVVSMGGITGLFLGASLLSLAEIIYFFSVRLISSRYISRKADSETDEWFEKFKSSYLSAKFTNRTQSVTSIMSTSLGGVTKTKYTNILFRRWRRNIQD